jgi:hypothetical protein
MGQGRRLLRSRILRRLQGLTRIHWATRSTVPGARIGFHPLVHHGWGLGCERASPRPIEYPVSRQVLPGVELSCASTRLRPRGLSGGAALPCGSVR